MLAVSLWLSGRFSVSHTGVTGFDPGNLFKIIIFLSLNSLNSVKTFRENSNKRHAVLNCWLVRVSIMVEMAVAENLRKTS